MFSGAVRRGFWVIFKSVCLRTLIIIILFIIRTCTLVLSRSWGSTGAASTFPPRTPVRTDPSDVSSSRPPSCQTGSQTRICSRY